MTITAILQDAEVVRLVRGFLHLLVIAVAWSGTGCSPSSTPQRFQQGPRGFSEDALVSDTDGQGGSGGSGGATVASSGSGGGAAVDSGSGGSDDGCSEGDVRTCHVVIGEHGGVKSCFTGVRVCEDGVWGPCVDPASVDAGVGGGV